MNVPELSLPDCPLRFQPPPSLKLMPYDGWTELPTVQLLLKRAQVAPEFPLKVNEGKANDPPSMSPLAVRMPLAPNGSPKEKRENGTSNARTRNARQMPRRIRIGRATRL